MEIWNSLPRFVRQALIGLGLFIAGAIFSFGYSYRPLHGAMTWKVEQLETTLDARNRENLVLSDEIAALRNDKAARIDPETLKSVEQELDKTKRALSEAESKLDRAEKKQRESIASADRWRKRYEELRDTPPVAVASAPEPSPRPVQSEPSISPTPNPNTPGGVETEGQALPASLDTAPSFSPDVSTPPSLEVLPRSSPDSPIAPGIGILPHSEAPPTR